MSNEWRVYKYYFFIWFIVVSQLGQESPHCYEIRSAGWGSSPPSSCYYYYTLYTRSSETVRALKTYWFVSLAVLDQRGLGGLDLAVSVRPILESLFSAGKMC